MRLRKRPCTWPRRDRLEDGCLQRSAAKSRRVRMSPASTRLPSLSTRSRGCSSSPRGGPAARCALECLGRTGRPRRLLGLDGVLTVSPQAASVGSFGNDANRQHAGVAVCARDDRSRSRARRDPVVSRERTSPADAFSGSTATRGSASPPSGEQRLDEAGRQGYRVLACTAAGSEARLSFTSVRDLLVIGLRRGGRPTARARSGARWRWRSCGKSLPGRLRSRRRSPSPSSLSLRMLARGAPVLVAVDDVQWVDPRIGRPARVRDAPARAGSDCRPAHEAARNGGSHGSRPRSSRTTSGRASSRSAG